ncbi:MAG TPA: glutamate--tRNA ligase family protein [Gemmatimonadales bacterium]|nr:glutamate--tRNA ligase family protein [Gemmatimonadales bacterium]
MPPLDLAALRGRLPPSPITRFAPSPTGFLHLGHVANAICVWGVARALGGRVLLRVEDHDRGRSRPEYEAAALEDLEWLGLAPDLGTPAELRLGTSPHRQSDCERAYAAALEGLARTARVYACDCTRKDIAAEAGDPLDQETRYPGRCRDRGLPLTDGRGIRIVMEPGAETFADALLGVVTQAPSEQCGDLLLRDRTGNWTYQFAVVVDDDRHDVDLVVRGEDLLPSTGRQIRLSRMLGRERPPVFLHHPLIRKEDGAKLSKSSEDTGVRELRRAGASPEMVLGRAAWLTGLVEQPVNLSAEDLPSLFRLSHRRTR